MFNIYDYLLFYICDSLLLQVLIFIFILSRHFLLFDDDDLPPSLLYKFSSLKTSKTLNSRLMLMYCRPVQDARIEIADLPSSRTIF